MKKIRLVTVGDVPFLALLLAASWLIAGTTPETAATGLRITTRGEAHVFPLLPRQHEVVGPLGTSVVEVTPEGTMHFLSSPCPLKLCLRMGEARGAGSLRVCVPNEVMIELIGRRSASTLDGVTR